MVGGCRSIGCCTLSYPATLAELQKTLDWDLPKDPFSGKDVVYQRRNDGFKLYSLWSDLDDDGGLPVQQTRYKDGDIVVNQGDDGDCMYVIQSGNVEVFQKRGEKEVHLAVLGEPDFFGEMALFEKEVRSATIRAKGDARILTVDKKTFLNRIQEDPSMAFRIVEKMSQRIRYLNSTLTRIKAVDRRNWEERSEGDSPLEAQRLNEDY